MREIDSHCSKAVIDLNLFHITLGFGRSPLQAPRHFYGQRLGGASCRLHSQVAYQEQHHLSQSSIFSPETTSISYFERWTALVVCFEQCILRRTPAAAGDDLGMARMDSQP